MSVSVTSKAVVGAGGQSVALSSLIQVTASSTNPTYLILNGYDRNEYTAGASTATGSFQGQLTSVGLTAHNGDARETGIIFTYQAVTGRYFNSSVGYLDQLVYSPSTSVGDITDLSLFGTNSLSVANSYKNDPVYLSKYDPGGFLGTVTIATEPGFAGPVPAQATPDSIAGLADSFVGQSWNMDGCWVLTSTIAAEAGASLPVQSTADIAGLAGGEWFVAFNGPSGSSGDWASMVRPGDMVGFVTSAGSGHITTVVSGSGSSADVVDNITYVDGSGNVLNAANDGSAYDVIIAAPHPAWQEFDGVQASSVVIYRLDTPIVTANTGALQLGEGTSESVASLFSAADPAGKSVAEYQVYLANASDALTVNGAEVSAYSAATAAAVSTLSQVNLDTAGLGADTLAVRAYNGSYWGDWATLTIDTVLPTAGVGSATLPVYRFFDATDGTHFFTANLSEATTVLATRPDMTYEGVGLNAIASPGSDSAAEAVYRFFDTATGTHFFTASLSEANSILATQPAMTLEGTAFYEDATQQAGDLPVYRFFDTLHGTHLYTESASERASILATRPDLSAEGIAFYAPSA